MTKLNFVHLRAHSDYSIIDGIAKVKTLIKTAVTLKMPALAITDFTNLFGVIKFYKEAHSSGIKPIIGADFRVHNELSSNNRCITKITALAMNNIGYKNLTLLISRAYQRGYDSSGPWINRNWLSELNEGILLISNGCVGDIGKYLLSKKNHMVKKCILFYQKYFQDRFYLELIRTGRSNEENYIHLAMPLAEKYKLPVVATNDIRFIQRSDFNAHEIRVAIYHGVTLDSPQRPHDYSPQQYMKSEQEMCNLFSDIPEALENSVEIAKRCNVTIDIGQYFLPKFPTGNMTTKDFLTMKAKSGLKERVTFFSSNKKKHDFYREKYNTRLNTELKVINNMGFSGYFLIVMEFIQWAKKNNIPVGPGRGSGAGSLVAYALKITDIDPLKFDLIFERFLNQERISMPDFDIDFCMEKRDQVIDHVADMYGQDSVSQIITFSTMAAKGSVRDVGRVLGYPYTFINKISKMIPTDPGITLLQAFKTEKKLLKIYQTHEEVKILIRMACQLEGVIRNIGKHAGGVVISPTRITDFSPLYYNESGSYPLTQFDKDDIEYIGLVKFDFLGLRTLTVINYTINMVNKKRKENNQPKFDITAIPLNDQKTFSILQRSETTAIFQLESRGMKDLIKRLQPDCFEDIIALIALFRPGPLQSGMVDNFINRKHGREKISYPDVQCHHDSLKPVLESTYGIILYQEQVIQIAQVLSGYTLGRADILRRAMSKKKPEEMMKQRTSFQEGAKKNGIPGKLAVKIFDLVEKFSGYGFNKSHSTAYALISYQTLWLKTHYSSEFMAAVLSSEMDNTEKLVDLIDECRRMKLTVLSPDINSGFYHFHVNNNKEIIYGIGAIKGIGKESIEEIIESRKKNGPFRDLFDLCKRINNKKLNRRMLEKLIKSGALDKFSSCRSELMNSLENTLKAATQYTKEKFTKQFSMFDSLKKDLVQIQESLGNKQLWSEHLTLKYERETLGLYLTKHPIDQYSEELAHYIGVIRLKDTHLMQNNKIITVVGVIISVKIIINKQGNYVGICILDDCSYRLEVIFSHDILKKYRKLLEEDQILIVTGQMITNSFKERFKIIAHSAMNLDQARGKYARKLIIFITKQQFNNKFLNKVIKFLEPYRVLKPYHVGAIPIYFFHEKINLHTFLNFRDIWFVFPKESLLNSLYNIFDEKQIKLVFN